MAQDILITPNRSGSPAAEIKFVGSDGAATNRYFKVNAFSDVDFLSDSKTFVNFGGSSKSFTVYTDTNTAVLDVSDTGGTVRLGIDAAHKIIVGSGTPGARLQVDTMGDAVKGVIVKANSGTQSANLTEWQNSGGTVLSSVSATGVFSGDGSGLTTLNAGNISSGTLAVARGGTGTATGSITGTGALTFTAGGTDTNVNLVPNGTGTVDVASKRITNVATPTGGTDAANKNYVDAIKQGLDIKDSVRVATTANITLSGAQTIDGVAVVAGDRVLVKDQSTASGNGIYDVASGAWTRSVDADVSSEVTAGMFVFVTEGTTNADSGWVLTTNDPITLGTTSLSFTQFSGAGQITAGAGLTKTGNTLDVGTASSARIVVNADNIDLASGVIASTGTYRSVTVDTYGRVTAGTNPTTFSGYGISDTSANLAAAITDETGTGLLVFNTDPALTRPALSAETFSTTNNVTAGTNAQGQGALTSDFNVITTAASNPSGVTLPTATQGRRIYIVNKGANAVNVYPASGATIDALAANAAISLPVNQLLEFNAASTTQWYSTVNSSVTTGVTSFSAGTTGLTPNSATTGAVTLAGTLAVANGGTGLTSGTSGGILAFTASGTLASSGVLAASALVIGGGAGVAPSTTTTGTGVVTALGVNVGTAGAFVVNGGALGTPSSGTLTSCTGLPLTTGVTGTLPVANGGTGTTSGSITGTGALTFTAGSTNTNVNLVPNGTGTVDVASKRITNVATPTSSTDAANKAYVDATKQGLDVKDSVRVATTANITLSGTQTIDGVAVIAGDRVLVKNQSTASGNGIYDVAAGAWSRSADADVSSEVTAGMFVFVEEGTTNADSGWVLTTDNPITLGTTSLTFAQFSGAGQITAGAGLTKTGNTIDAVGTANRITVNADSIDIASTYVGQNTITTLGTIATGTWQAGTVAVQYGGTGATTFTAGRILFGNGTSAINTNASLFWDNTNSRLGINQATPGAMVQIDSSAAGTKGLIVKAAATPTANLTEWQNSAGTNLAYMDSAGNFYAVSKSFLIKHPTKKKKNLRYACLEGPENGVYFRGKLVNGKTIKLPPYWTKLVDPDSITVTLTPREYPQPNLHVVSSDNKKVVVASDKKVCCDFVVYGVRVDIPTLEVEPNVPSS